MLKRLRVLGGTVGEAVKEGAAVSLAAVTSTLERTLEMDWLPLLAVETGDDFKEAFDIL